jgi:hypothetical protein
MDILEELGIFILDPSPRQEIPECMRERPPGPPQLEKGHEGYQLGSTKPAAATKAPGRHDDGLCRETTHYVLINDELQPLVKREVDDDNDALFELLPNVVFPGAPCDLEHVKDMPEQATKTVPGDGWMPADFKAAIARGVIPLMQPVKQPLLMVSVKHELSILARGGWTLIAVDQSQLAPGYYK